jgi:ATP-binding cassette subfamily B protein
MNHHTSSDTKGRADIRILKRLGPYLWPDGQRGLKIRVVMAMAFLVLAKGLTVLTPFFLKDTIDLLTLNSETDKLAAVPFLMIFAYGAARFLSIIFGEIRDLVFVKVSQNALRRLAVETFKHLHNLSLAFHLDRKTGGLSRAIERGTRSIEFVLRFMLFNILPTLLELGLVTSIFFIHFGSQFGYVMVVSVGLYILLTLLVTEWRLKYRRAMNKQDTVANTKAIDSLLNFETVKYFGNEDHEVSRYDQALYSYQQAAVKSQFSLSFLNILQAGVINAGLVVAMIFAAQAYIAGSLSMGDFVLANTLLIQLFLPLNFLGFVYREIKQSLVDMEQMFSLLDKNSEIQDAPNAKPYMSTGGTIEFKNVCFSYHVERPILKDVSFKVPAGKKTAIVGPSGAGKSTISRILFRFYEIDTGAVLVDGQNIKDITQKSLRAAIGMVPQDTVLFNDTIHYNIEYGRPGAGDEDINNAAQLAQIQDFIAELPDGMQTMVGERGLKLSGGEKQRVAIARTILKDPPILLLDEATSALDSQTEQDIQESLKTVSKNRTTLVIAHRLSTIVDADEILVLDKGKIIERGTHDKLLVKKGVYADMWARQQEAARTRERLIALEKNT